MARFVFHSQKRWRGPAPLRDTDSQAQSHCLIRAVECQPAMVLVNGNHDALTDGICSWSVDLVRSLVGRVRNHHPASHRGPDATYVRKVLQVELVALGGADDRRFRPDLPGVGAAIPVDGWIGWLWHAALHERVNFPDAWAG